MESIKVPGLRRWDEKSDTYTPHPNYFPPMKVALIKSTSSNHIIKCTADDGVCVCFKTIKKTSTRQSKESKFLLGLDHRNVVKLIAVLKSVPPKDERLTVMVMPFYKTPLSAHAFLNYEELLGKVAGCVIPALKYIHSKGIVHMDIKPQNIMVDESRELTLVDFDCAMISGETKADVVGTFPFMSPEIAVNYNIPRGSKRRTYVVGPHLDLWCLGVTLEHLQVTRSSAVEDRAEDLYRKAVADLKVLNPNARGRQLYYGRS